MSRDEPVGPDMEVKQEKEIKSLEMSPEQISSVSKPPTKDVFVLIDTSGSMSGKKLERAKRAMRKFQRRCLIHDRFACGHFSDSPYLSMPLTPCNKEVSLSSFSDSWEAEGGTALYDSLDWAIRNLVTWRKQNPEQASQKGQIVVLTDGQDADSKLTVREVQRTMLSARPDIQVVLVGIGATGKQLRQLSQGDERDLAELVQDEEDNGEAIDRSLRRVRDADRDRLDAYGDESVAIVYPRAQARSRSRSRSRSPPASQSLKQAKQSRYIPSSPVYSSRSRSRSRSRVRRSPVRSRSPIRQRLAARDIAPLDT